MSMEPFRTQWGQYLKIPSSLYLEPLPALVFCVCEKVSLAYQLDSRESLSTVSGRHSFEQNTKLIRSLSLW